MNPKFKNLNDIKEYIKDFELKHGTRFGLFGSLNGLQMQLDKYKFQEKNEKCLFLMVDKGNDNFEIISQWISILDNSAVDEPEWFRILKSEKN